MSAGCLLGGALTLACCAFLAIDSLSVPPMELSGCLGDCFGLD